MSTNLQSYFVQDDWQIAPKLKVLYGLRYDLYRYLDGLSSAPPAQTQSFNIDKNNWGPRPGAAWAINGKTVLRASTGIMATRRFSAATSRHCSWSGSPRPLSTATTARPPVRRRSRQVSTGTVATQSPWAIDPDFQVAHTWQGNAQLERSFSQGPDGLRRPGCMGARSCRW